MVYIFNHAIYTSTHTHDEGELWNWNDDLSFFFFFHHRITLLWNEFSIRVILLLNLASLYARDLFAASCRGAPKSDYRKEEIYANLSKCEASERERERKKKSKCGMCMLCTESLAAYYIDIRKVLSSTACTAAVAVVFCANMCKCLHWQVPLIKCAYQFNSYELSFMLTL